MTTKEIVKNLMENADISYVDMAERLGTSKQNVWGWLNAGKEDIKQRELLRLLGALGYKLMIVPGDAQTPIGSIEIKER